MPADAGQGAPVCVSRFCKKSSTVTKRPQACRSTSGRQMDNKYANNNYAIDHAPQCSTLFTLAQSQPHPDLQSKRNKRARAETLVAAGCDSPGGSEIAIMSSQIISTRTLQGQIHAIWRRCSVQFHHVVCAESTECTETMGTVLRRWGLY